MARCPSCNKFASYDELDPEVELDIDADGVVSGTVRIVNASQCCAEEMRETVFDVAWTDGAEGHEEKDGHELSVEETSSSRTMRAEGKGRYAKTFYGALVEFTVRCTCEKYEVQGTWEDDIQASAMDEM